MTPAPQLELYVAADRLERVLDQVVHVGDRVRDAVEVLGPDPKGRAREAVRHLNGARAHVKSALIHGGRLGVGAVLVDVSAPPAAVEPVDDVELTPQQRATEAARLVDRHKLAESRVILNLPGAAGELLLELVERADELELELDAELLAEVRARLVDRVNRYRNARRTDAR